VAVSQRLVEFLPGPKATKLADGTFDWFTPSQSIGRVHGWHGNALVLARALAYINVHGGDGLKKVAQHAVLNANWLRHRLRDTLPAAYDRPCMHEAVLTASALKTEHGVRGLDVAKALLEEGFHSPTVYFPLIVDEALMFEPTETESLQTLEALAVSIEKIAALAVSDPERLMRAPQTTPVSRVDEARAARQLVSTEDAATR
jgi:glycine dehydrogenase subunit 2